MPRSARPAGLGARRLPPIRRIAAMCCRRPARLGRWCPSSASCGRVEINGDQELAIMKRLLLTMVAAVILLASSGRMARAEDMPAKYRDVVNKGLDYLAKVQNRDGHWEAN